MILLDVATLYYFSIITLCYKLHFKSYWVNSINEGISFAFHILTMSILAKYAVKSSTEMNTVLPLANVIMFAMNNLARWPI